MRIVNFGIGEEPQFFGLVCLMHIQLENCELLVCTSLPMLALYQPCVLKLWTVNGRFVKKKSLDVQILSLCYTSAPEGVYINVIIGGMANGTIRFDCTSHLVYLIFCVGYAYLNGIWCA